jgi:Flp pilus assembly pilin Flp
VRRGEKTGGQLSAMFGTINRWLSIRDDDGQALVEYSLILLFVALVTFLLLGQIGQALTGMFSAVLAAF